MSASTPEGRVKAKIKDYIRSLPGHTWLFMPVQSGRGVVGVPDILCCIGGRLVAIEVKAPGKEARVTPNQRWHLDRIRLAGGVAMVGVSVDQVRSVLIAEGVVAGKEEAPQDVLAGLQPT